MSKFPRDARPDRSLSALRDGYRFIGKTCDALGSDAFRTRLMLRPVTCVRGEEAAAMFYHSDRFTRIGAMPPTTLRLLQDKGSVQSLSGDAHRHRKALFLSLTGPEGTRRVADLFEAEWRRRLPLWERQGQIVLHEEAQELLCQAALTWLGLHSDAATVRARTQECAAMIHGAGAVGPRLVRGLRLRARAERWARRQIVRARQDSLAAPPASPLRVLAEHHDLDGKPLPVNIAAVELINLLRPTVAIAVYIADAALVLHQQPELLEPLRKGPPEYAQWFAQELRRCMPFFPGVGGRVREPFEWRGERFRRGRWVLLDFHGTHMDNRSWPDPQRFDPERFRHQPPRPYALIAQGGGDHASSHRCPGEWMTIEIIARSARLLANAMRYRLPPQDLQLQWSRLPATPKSGVILSEIRAA